MKNSLTRTWLAAAVLLIATGCVLTLFWNSAATAQPPTEPFANSVRQRAEMIHELREIKELLRRQNEMLSEGKLRVQIVLPEGAAR
jgi:hypothetical protein